MLLFARNDAIMSPSIPIIPLFAMSLHAVALILLVVRNATKTGS